MKKNNQILVVDDDYFQCKIIKSILVNNGYSVHSVSDGEEAISYIKNSFPGKFLDLIISDIDMPNVNGFELLKALSAMNSSIPVIMITAHDNEDYFEKAFQLGALDYISSPFTRRRLLTRVQNMLNLQQQKAALEERIKELNCFYNFINIVETPNIALDEVYIKLVNIIPDAFKFSDSVSAVLKVFDEEIKTPSCSYSNNSFKSNIIVNEQIVGELRIYRNSSFVDDIDFMDYEKLIIGVICERLGRLIELTNLKISEKKARDELEQLVMYDSLTGALNRKPFFNLAEKNISRAKRNCKKAALLFIDIDKFKKINDTFGHDKGDLVLKRVAKKIMSCIRKSDLLCRFGGDEFLLYLNDINLVENINLVIQKIHKVFLKKYETKNFQIKISVSIGVAVFPDNGKDISQLIKYSDMAMYKEKDNLTN